MIPGGSTRAQQRVGAAMFGFLLVAAVFVVAILPRLDLGDGVRVEVGFEHVGALRTGAPVIVAGRAVGKIEGITLVDPAGLPADHVLAGTGGAIVHVRIREAGRRYVPINGDFFVSSKGVLSDRYLEVGPPRDGAAMGRPVQGGDQVRGIDPPSIDRALQRTWDNLVKSRAFLDAVQPHASELMARIDGLARTLDEVAPAPGAYGELATRLRALGDEAGELRDLLDAAGADPARLGDLAGRARATFARARAAVTGVQGAADRLLADLDRVRASLGRREPELERLRAAIAEAQGLLARVDQVVARGQDLLALVERGEGSLAKLAADPEFPEDAKELGKILKRQPWRIVGRPDDATATPRPPAPRPSGQE